MGEHPEMPQNSVIEKQKEMHSLDCILGWRCMEEDHVIPKSQEGYKRKSSTSRHCHDNKTTRMMVVAKSGCNSANLKPFLDTN